MISFELRNKLLVLEKQFFCNLRTSEIEWDESFKDSSYQALIVRNTIQSAINTRQPVKRSYQIAFLKFIIGKIEESSQDSVEDALYNKLAELIAQPDHEDKCFRHYFPPNGLLSIEEQTQIISHGTTGLRTWEAAPVLAQWCLFNKTLLKQRTIVELGSGVGLVGLTVFLNCHPKQIILTDCHEQVLQQLTDNIENNIARHVNPPDSRVFDITSEKSTHCILRKCIEFRDELGDSSNVISVQKYAWNDNNDAFMQQTAADILLAADVVYDPSLFDALIGCVIAFLNRSQISAGAEKPKAIFVCTERNADTLNSFLQLLGEKCLIEEGEIPQQKEFVWSTETPIRLFNMSRMETHSNDGSP